MSFLSLLAIPLIFLLILLAAVFVFVAFSVIVGRGAVYVPADQEVVRKMVKLANPKPGDKFVDLGSGDGRIVIAFARAGAESHGYEVNPLLVWISRRNIRAAGLTGKAFIHGRSFWKQDLSGFNIVAVYGVTYIMRKLKKKLKKESQSGSRLVSYLFEFPGQQPLKKEKGVYLYKIK